MSIFKRYQQYPCASEGGDTPPYPYHLSELERETYRQYTAKFNALCKLLGVAFSMDGYQYEANFINPTKELKR